MVWTAATAKTLRVRKLTSSALLCLHLSAASMALSTVGCRITSNDVQAWGTKASGPRKLVAVLQHERYPTGLRIKAAETLVTMPPRGGHPLGLLGDEDSVGLLKGLTVMSRAQRTLIVDGLVPSLERGIVAEVKKGESDQSFAYKDTAYALLQTGDKDLVSNPKSQERLKAALVSWCQHHFLARIDNSTQIHSMEQVLRFVGADGVRGLTPLISSDFKKLRRLSALIKELGDENTRVDASKRLAKVARFVDSSAWIKKKTSAVKAANKTSGLKVSDKQLKKQLKAFQGEELQRVFGAMKTLGEKPTVDYLLAYSANKANPEKKRAAALAGLKGHLDRNSPVHAKALLDLMSSDESPDLIRDVAARRIGELSRTQVAERLYALFSHERWQLRWSVASLILKLSEKKDIAEFMQRLGKIKDMALSEPFTYGTLLAEIKGVNPTELLKTYSKATLPAPVRLSALGYFYQKGSQDEIPLVSAFKSDSQKVPECRKDAQQCAWECTVPSSSKGAKAEVKAVKTLGNFVEYCLVPSMAQRKPVNDVQDDAKPGDTRKRNSSTP